jgi:rare lipoprotein A
LHIKRIHVELFCVFLTFIHGLAAQLERVWRASRAAMPAVLLIALSGCSHRVSSPRPARIGSTETGIASWYGRPYHGRRAASGEIYDMEKFTAAHKKLPFQTWVEVTNLANGKRVDVRINDRGPFVKGRIIDLSLAAARDLDMVRSGTTRVRLRVIRPPAVTATVSGPPAPGGADPPESPPPAHAAAAQAPASQSDPQAGASEVTSTPAADSIAPGLAEPDMSPERSQPASATETGAPSSTSRERVRRKTYAVQAGAFADGNRAEALRASLPFRDTRVVPPDASRPLWRVLIGRQMSLDAAEDLAGKVRQQTGTALVVEDR